MRVAGAIVIAFVTGAATFGAIGCVMPAVGIFEIRHSADCTVHTVTSADIDAPSRRGDLSAALRARMQHPHRYGFCIN